MENYEQELVFELKDVYEKIIFDGTIEDDGNPFKELLIDVVDENNQLTANAFSENPGAAYLFDGSLELIRSFMKRSGGIIEQSVNVGKKLSLNLDKSIDLSTIVLPYVITRMGIANAEIHLFVGLAFCISKIVVSKIETSTKEINTVEEVPKIDELQSKYNEILNLLSEEQKQKLSS